MAKRLTSIHSLLWIALLVLGLSPLLAYGDCEGLNKRWSTTYRPAFKVDLKPRVFGCEDSEKDFVIAQAIDDLYASDDTHNFYVTARRLIHSLEVAPHAKSCEDRVAAYMGDKNKVTICEPFFKLNRVRRAAILFHEASHGRAKDPGHVNCEAGEAKDKKTCDAALNEGYDGSGHNWEVHYVRYLLQTSTDEIVKENSRKYLEFLLTNRINGLNEAAKKNWLN